MSSIQLVAIMLVCLKEAWKLVKAGNAELKPDNPRLALRALIIASAALPADAALAHEAHDAGQQPAPARGAIAIPEVGFAARTDCAKPVSHPLHIAGGLGRMGGFDLGRLGAPLEPVRFGNAACKSAPGLLSQRDLRADETGFALADGASASAQFMTPGSSAKTGETAPEAAKDAFTGDYAIVALGLGSIPTYEGSAHSRFMPVPGAMGRIRGVEFRILGPSLALDFIKGKPDAKIGLALGPAIRYRFNRSGKSGDVAVDRLGKLKGVIEAGVGGGVTVKRVLTPYDLLALGVSARWDVSGRGSGMIVSTSASYLMPISKAQVVGALASADFVDRRFARYNYSVTPAGSAASGLPVFIAKGGFKAASAGVFTARDLNGDILDGGFALGVGALYSKLHGSAAKTPITSQRGKRNQWIIGGGLAYTF